MCKTYSLSAGLAFAVTLTTGWPLGMTSLGGLVLGETKVQHIDLTRACSQDAKIRRQAQATIASRMRQSETARARIVQELLGELRATPADLNQQHFEKWSCVAQILAESRAVEAVELLVQHADYNDGTSGLSLGHYPVLKAIVKMGEPAIPNLAQVLSADKALQVRLNAIRALRLIGGRQAKRTLQQQLEQEQDPEVRRSLEEALSALAG